MPVRGGGAPAKSDSGNSNMDGHLLSMSAKWLDNNEGTMKVTTFVPRQHPIVRRPNRALGIAVT